MELPFPIPIPSFQIPALPANLLTGVGSLIAGLVVGLLLGYLIAWYKYYWSNRHKWGLIEEEETRHY